MITNTGINPISTVVIPEDTPTDEPDLKLPDVSIDDISPEIINYYTMIHSRASAGEQ